MVEQVAQLPQQQNALSFVTVDRSNGKRADIAVAAAPPAVAKVPGGASAPGGVAVCMSTRFGWMKYS